ncbi:MULTISPECIES: hypothetical protein [Streptomyces]|uniref:Uncharacterized protein n=2 Tax=Streptomyces TaxID=1883 RepID=A0A3R7J8J9_9ACTN|nr:MULTISPECIES: hypothetical protein [Streptomyces]KNE83971.1 hypothetical protein ADZ36_01335 [Streptomyces fradiae]OFA36991.1 hypothetical protein BEN35_29395 [Streptomyces fradiae]PQM24656.1 hypothetical protein Sfr7A_00025 [Streptomyces xinghaiensis]RKM98711.1 hypothetical protein SFRA_000025 [Streptomyces xinghaiensis]RNC76391.1 hypothetical protein DC095_004350 [Streptomyces xinghaiensis]
MADPITLAALSALALSEGVKFLYGQAGEVLRQRRERKAAAVELPTELFESSGGTLQPDLARADELEPELRQLRQSLSEYGQGVDEIDPQDGPTVELVHALRRTLETIYRRPIVFVGESKQDDGIDLTSDASVKEVRGYVAAVRARTIRSGSIKASLRADSVEQGGQAIGLDVGDIG